jgi:predicted methyltransferase
MAAAGSTDSLKLIHGDFRLICRKEIPGNSINLILTDPPHGSRRLYLYEALNAEAFRVLKESGSLLAYASHNALPEALVRP